MPDEITVIIKLFSGIAEDCTIIHDYGQGITIKIKAGTRLKGVLKSIGLKKLSRNVYFCNGERISLRRKCRDGDTISCLKPSGGG